MLSLFRNYLTAQSVSIHNGPFYTSRVSSSFAVCAVALVLVFSASCSSPKRVDDCQGAKDDSYCDDGNPCTGDDRCFNDSCSGTALNDNKCDDGNTCTENDQCVVGECKGAVVQYAKACDDDNTCTTHDTCAGDTCLGYQIADGESCEDGNPCTVEDTCAMGQCNGAEKECVLTDDPCYAGICDAETGDCGKVMVADGTGCDDNDPCTVLTACAAGVCEGDAKDCSAVGDQCNDGVCEVVTGRCLPAPKLDGSACEEGDLCTLADTCESGVCISGHDKDCTQLCHTDSCDSASGACNGVPVADDTSCTDDNMCTVAGRCQSGACLSQELADGVLCDDNDTCTREDSCQAGLCTGGLDLCQCDGQPDDTTCDDLNPCTLNDVCTAGACGGSLKDCSALTDICNHGVCDIDSAACVQQPKFPGTLCDDGDACTENDQCNDGGCGGTAKDCSGLSTDCYSGECNATSGVCEALALSGNTCDDQNACSGEDSCVSGTCIGGADLCGACTGLAVGDNCDDNDLCTVDTTCVAQGSLLVCTPASVVDCSSEDSSCTEGVCDPTTGLCASTNINETGSCDDLVACTEQDICTVGVCAGTPVSDLLEACGIAAPNVCEPLLDNNNILFNCVNATCADTSTVVAMNPVTGITVIPSMTHVKETEAILYGRVNDDAGDIDHYSVTLTKDKFFTAEVTPSCLGTLSAELCLFDGSGNPLSICAYGYSGAAAKLDRIAIPQDGIYFLRVKRLGSSTVIAHYLLSLQQERERGCMSNADCGCAIKSCEIVQGEIEGVCIDSLPAEIEPNDLASQSQTMITTEIPATTTSSFLGKIDSATDRDRFNLLLVANQPVEITATDYCGERVAVKLSLSADGIIPVSTNHQDPSKAVRFTASATNAGAYKLRVEPQDPNMLTPYQINVRDRRCTQDAECDCTAVQSCNLLGGTVGICEPKIGQVEAEPNDNLETATPLTLALGTVGAVTTNADAGDWYKVDLATGSHIVTTTVYCGSTETLDTVVAMYDAVGVLVAEDPDWTTLSSLTVDIVSAGTYYVKVSASGYSRGDYLLNVIAN